MIAVTPAAPAVSVLVATYNRRHLLRQALTSVLSQTFQDFEIVVVDDGSTDDTEAMVRELASAKIAYVKLPKNIGRSAARNEGLKQVRGRFVAFLDSDDFFASDKLEIQVALLEAQPEYGMCYSSAQVIDEESRPVDFEYPAKASGSLYYDIAFYRPLTILLPTVMVRRGILEKSGGFDVKLNRFEDTDLWRRVAKLTPILACERKLTTVRTHSGNRMERPELVQRDLDYYVEKVLREDRSGFSRWKQRRLASRFYFHYSRAIYLNPDWTREARPLLRRSIAYSPINLGPYIVLGLDWVERHSEIEGNARVPGRVWRKLKSRALRFTDSLQ